MLTRQKLIVVALIIGLAIGILLFLIFPPSLFLGQKSPEPVILYYDYENMPFTPSQFPLIANTTLAHHFNTLMLLVYVDHKPIFNYSTLQYFLSYSTSRNLTFVPSYYIESLNDTIDVSGFHWINLDMERILSKYQRFFYTRTMEQGVGKISVTFPHGQTVDFSPSINIVETYSGYPTFWLMQLAYFHYDHICSVGVWLTKTQHDYDSEKNYCLKYSDGVMVFDYYNLLKSGLN